MKNKCIIIIGMMRTGTSLTARIFHELGVFLTSTPGMFDAANKEGEYENLEITSLNSSILRNNGGEWNNPVIVNNPDKRCGDIINKYQKNIWGWKDNRTAFTFNCYKPYLDSSNVMFIITHRDKESTIDSLFRTHLQQFPEKDRNRKYMGNLYDKYYSAIDEVTKDYNRIDIHYEELINNKFFNRSLRHF